MKVLALTYKDSTDYLVNLILRNVMNKHILLLVVLFTFVGSMFGTTINDDKVLPPTASLEQNPAPISHSFIGKFEVHKVIKKHQFDTILATMNGEMYMIVSKNRKLTNLISHKKECDLEVKSYMPPGLMNAREYSAEGRYSFHLEKRYKTEIKEVYLLEGIIVY